MLNIEMLIENLKTCNFQADFDFEYLAPLLEDVETFDDITTALDDNGSFNIDIIYYSTAMEYLSNNDSSLNESLALASDMGIEMQNLNSETLASLLASENARDEWYTAQSKVEQFIEDCTIEEEEEEEEE